jgi:hypothetical protein
MKASIVGATKKASPDSRRHARSEELEPTGGKVPIRCDLIERSGTSKPYSTDKTPRTTTLVVLIRRLNEEGFA